jgi:hypothetical protein
MTLFANSGVAWPTLEEATRLAGARSLDAFSQIWQVLADLEGRRERSFGTSDLLPSAESLQEASSAYARIAEELRGVIIDRMTPAELDIAGINVPSRRLLYSDPDYWSHSFFRLFLENGVQLGSLYRELAQRTANLASSIRAFEVRRPNADLAPQAFQLMQQLETLAILGRAVAVLNQRRPGSGPAGQDGGADVPGLDRPGARSTKEVGR